MDEGNQTNYTLNEGKNTSEYRIALICQMIASVFVMTGVIAPHEADGMANAAAVIIGGLISIYSAGMYIYSRLSVKREIIKSGQPIKISNSQRG